MTATAEATTVAVNCRECHRPIRATHDQIRAEIDDDVAIPCEWCESASQASLPPRLTAADVIVAAAAQMGELHYVDGLVGVPLSDIIIKAWEIAPEKFGMSGYEEIYPDSNRVSCEVSKMLRRLPNRPVLLEKVGPRRYRLTPAGKVRAAALEGHCGNRK